MESSKNKRQLDDFEDAGAKSTKKLNTNDKKDKIKINLFPVDAYTKHKILMNQYVLNKPGFQFPKFDVKTDLDILKQNHKFLWSDDDDSDDEEANESNQSWGERLAKKYYDRLYKEYCICDLSKYKENKIALRWRIEREVILGKGQFICANKVCDLKDDLKSWEVNFAYKENDEKKNALVKLRLCPECSNKLNYHHKKKEITSTNTETENSEISKKVDDFLQSLLV